jgi:hypothetical protein
LLLVQVWEKEWRFATGESPLLLPVTSQKPCHPESVNRRTRDLPFI